MAIQMVGIDHNSAGIDVRTAFSFTKKRTGEALDFFRRTQGVLGCVLLSTCNRCELWLSTSEAFETDPYQLLCEAKGLEEQQAQCCRTYAVFRSGREAEAHLFTLACGLDSRILGEDQIITQVKEALVLAREHYATDNVTETLFRTAVTAAKRVKTEVALTGSNRSVIHQAIETLEKKGFSVRGKTCMVIGNGMMGKLAATLLVKKGAQVTVTVRQYRSGLVEIPENCRRIDYGERMSLFPSCELIVSATASPNFTLKKEQIAETAMEHETVLLDLAVPRDIEPSVRELPGIRLYDVDDFRTEGEDAEFEERLKKVQRILDEERENFDAWYECRDIVPQIQRLKEKAADDCMLRLTKVLRGLSVPEDEKRELTVKISGAVEKTVNRMLFGLRDQVDSRILQECVEGLERIYED